MRRCGWGRKTAWAAALLMALFLPQPGLGHFSVAPKLEVGPADLEGAESVFLTLGETTASRGDFHRYLQRITAFDTKYDRMQPTFWLHLELVRSIALLHPRNVHSIVDDLREARALPERHYKSVGTSKDKG